MQHVNLFLSVLLKLDCQMIYQMMRSPFLNTLLFRLDRNRHGGGIVMYVHSSIMVNTLLLSPSSLEFMLVCLLTPHVSAVLVYCIYRPPNSPTSIFEILYLHLLRINILIL